MHLHLGVPTLTVPCFYITGCQPLRPEAILLATLAVAALSSALYALGHTEHARSATATTGTAFIETGAYHLEDPYYGHGRQHLRRDAHMGKLLCGMMQSLGGYIAGTPAGPQLPPPGPELHRHFNASPRT